MKRILAISGSPRRNSNSALLCNSCLQAAAAEGAQTRLLELCHLQIAPCQACRSCVNFAAGERCVIDDDMATVLADMLWADAIVFATPTYMAGMSAQLKALIDRTRPIWSPENTLQHRTASVGRPGTGCEVRDGLLLQSRDDRRGPGMLAVRQLGGHRTSRRARPSI